MKYLRTLGVIALLSLCVSNTALAGFIFASNQTAFRDFDRDNIADEDATYARDYIVNTSSLSSRVFVKFFIEFLDRDFNNATLSFFVDNYESLSLVDPNLYPSNHFQISTYETNDFRFDLSEWESDSQLLTDVVEISPYVKETPNSRRFERIEYEFDITEALQSALSNGEQFFALSLQNPIETLQQPLPGLLTANNFSIETANVIAASNVSAPANLGLIFCFGSFIFYRRKVNS